MGGKAIREFPGLGPKSEAMLARAGITSFAQLEALGAPRAFAMVRQTAAKPSLNLLWGWSRQFPASRGRPSRGTSGCRC
jgi:DNA transformation protein and related proteins